MDSDPYVPTMEVIQDAVTFPRERLGEPRPISPEAFARFIAKVRADALREFADKWGDGVEGFPYWPLHECAAETEQEARDGS